ncbi:hypothetical protein [Streptomyces sp. NPDC058701]|uniref:hypothetical protein n=1 Tax=Streptomyces sp. NPDC058701 TaxID=3346608 RepID=UPI0036572AA5
MICAEAGTNGYAYPAELYRFAPGPVVSGRPILDEGPGRPETRRKVVAAALDAPADVPPPTDREAVREDYLRRAIPECRPQAAGAPASAVPVLRRSWWQRLPRATTRSPFDRV